MHCCRRILAVYGQQTVNQIATGSNRFLCGNCRARSGAVRLAAGGTTAASAKRKSGFGADRSRSNAEKPSRAGCSAIHNLGELFTG